MARLASQIKMGYYPTPVDVVARVKEMLHIPEGARLLDPCCGEGEALALLAEGTGASSYGVELERERFKKSREVLDCVLWADALYEATVSKKAFSLLWLNPPYDTDTVGEQQRKQRAEIQFLKKYWNCLQPNGVLVYIIPAASARYAAPLLSARCSNLAIMKFPDQSFWDFKQIVIICRKARPGKQEIASNNQALETAHMAPYSYQVRKSIPSIIENQLSYEVPSSQVEREDLVFVSHRLDPEEAFQHVRKSSAWARAAAIVFSSKRHNEISPLMPLREGHLAMLLASGMMNGEVLGEDGQKLVVKGSVCKVQDTQVEETKDEIKYISTDRYEITVRAICFDPLEIIEIK
ncbi:MAG: class I SAM-dependent methyltransferase [Deltaproteobacteria bacterium]|nr:class I SAM-dependent methyltransferase [Deltaproteobacteria bacterium]